MAAAFANFIYVGVTLTLIVRARNYGASSASIGLMLAIVGAAGVLGALVAPRLRRRATARAVMSTFFCLGGATLPFLAFVENPYALGVIAAIPLFMAPPCDAVVVGTRLVLTPDNLRGRVNSAARLAAGGLTPLGSLAAGALISATNTKVTLLALGGCALALAAVATSTESIRHPPRIDRGEATQEFGARSSTETA